MLRLGCVFVLQLFVAMLGFWLNCLHASLSAILLSRTCKVTPTLLPSSMLWDFVQGRLLLGQELLKLQGTQFSGFVLSSLSNHMQTDLAGNALCS